MRYTHTGQLPKHIYVYVDSSFTHKEDMGFIPAVWFGLVSYPSRAWGCTVILESGAVYRNLPPHAIAFDPHPSPWSLPDAQTWDCYGWDFSTLEYDYLRELNCCAKTQGGLHYRGSYLFSVSPVDDAFSASPDQSKEFTFIRLDNGRLTIQPTNHVIFEDRSFTDIGEDFPRGLKRQEDTYSSE